MSFSRIVANCFVAGCLIAALPAVAQPPGQNPRGVTFGHIHLISADPDVAIAFWKDFLGASPYSRESLNGVITQGGTIFFDRNVPTGPSTGSAIDRIGLRVPDLQPVIERLKKTPYKGFQPVAGGDKLVIDGPDGVRIELTEESTMYTLLEFDRIHLYSAKADDAQGWYGKVFGARAGTDDQSHISRVPGGVLAFSQADAAVPSAGRAIDHLSLEVKDLEGFCKTLAEEGIKLDSAPKAIPGLGMSVAYLTDPSGVRIELMQRIVR